MVKKELLDILVCPACKSSIELKNGKIVCLGCKLSFPVENDIPIMLIDKAEKIEK